VNKAEKKELERQAKAERRRYRRKAKAVLTRSEIAEQFRVLAAQVESGTFALGDTELDLPDLASFEVGYKLKRRGGHQIEVEIEWGDRMDVPLPQA
jgi:amphi-Trp domain-containing protein